MNRPAAVVRNVRRVVLSSALVLVLYGFARFDVVRLPPGALSPLYGVRAGDRLLVDRHARDGAVGQAWLFRGPAEELLLARAASAPYGLAPGPRAAMAEGALWLVCEREVPGVADSRSLGPIARERRLGRVLFVLPW